MSAQDLAEQEERDAPRTPIYYIGIVAILGCLALLLFWPFSTRPRTEPYCTSYLLETGRIAAQRALSISPAADSDESPSAYFERMIVELNEEHLRHRESIVTFHDYVEQVDAVVKTFLSRSAREEEGTKPTPPSAVLRIPRIGHFGYFECHAYLVFQSKLEQLLLHSRYVELHHYATELYGAVQELHLQLQKMTEDSVLSWGTRDGPNYYGAPRSSFFSKQEKVQHLEALQELARSSLMVKAMAAREPPIEVRTFETGKKRPDWW